MLWNSNKARTIHTYHEIPDFLQTLQSKNVKLMDMGTTPGGGAPGLPPPINFVEMLAKLKPCSNRRILFTRV